MTNRRFCIKVNIRDFIYFFMCFMCIRPEYLLQFSIMNKIYKIGIILSIFLIACSIIKRKYRLPLSNKTLIVIYIWLFISTLINHAGIKNYFDSTMLPLSAILIAYYGMNTNSNKFLRSLEVLLVLYTLLNLLSMIIYPTGMNWKINEFTNGVSEVRFFFGQKNVVCKFTLLTDFCILLRKSLNQKEYSWFEKIMVVAIFSMGVISKSAVTMLSTFLPMLFAFVDFRRVPWYINTIFGAILNFLFFIYIVVQRKQDYFSFFIEDILGKNLTLSSRTRLWDRAMYLINKNELIGYGIESKTIATLKNGFANDSFHNFFVDYLYQGGIVAILLWIIFFLVLFYEIEKINEIRIRKIGHVFSFAYLIICISEPFTRTRITTYVIFITIISLLAQNRGKEK